MTRDDIIRLALDAGLLNYVDNETPRRYFIHGHADLDEVQKFAQLIVQECVDVTEVYRGTRWGKAAECIGDRIKEHFNPCKTSTKTGGGRK